MPRRRLWVAGAAVAAGVAIFGGSILWRARSALNEMRDRVAAEGDLRISVRPFAPAIPAGLEPVGAPAVFNDAQVFDGRLFLAGPAGLTAYDADGIVAARYRVGLQLPSAPVTALAVGLAGDSRAPELWIGTQGQGLVAFDGRAFRQILPEDADFAKITALLPVSTGRILIGTEKAGVLVYDGSHLRAFHSSVGNVHVTALAGDDADLWVATLDHGLLHWRAGAAETLADALPDKTVLSLATSGDVVYAGTALGVVELRGGAVTRTLASGYFAQSLYAADRKLWMGTLEEGMLEVPLDARAARGVGLRGAEVCPGCSIKKIFRMEREIYTLAEGSLWRGAETVLHTEDAVLKDRNVAALAMDSGGRLWIGYFDRGLQILSPGAHDRGMEFDDDQLFCINRIVHDGARGVSAVATANGLVLFDASTA
jgi:ligand-binding sensor domain-containing protein